jgi:DNA-binding Xre family transcriptional regulator
MIAIEPLERTANTVTLRLADFEAMLGAIEDAEDRLALLAGAAREAAIGVDAARADHLSADLLVRLVAGAHPVEIWREHRNMSPEALAERAGISQSEIALIVSGRKPGSVAAYRRLAEALRVTVDDLLGATA